MIPGPGTILAGKYRLDSMIGRGGMGTVWRAYHLGLHAPVAVKLLDGLDVGREAGARFHREAHAAASIRSPHIVQILDHGTDEQLNLPFIVMELLEGESLAERLVRLGRLAPEDVARIFTQLGRALGRAHESNIVHRDLKPDNVFVVRNDDDEVVKVLDFGIAKSEAGALGKSSATRTGAVMGTAYYMSPEQISGAKHVDYRSDLWALGVMACECLTGVRPFDAETIGGLTLKICVEPIPRASSLGPVPYEFDLWLERALSRDPRSRFATAREATESLRRVCLGEAAGSLTRPTPPPNPSAASAASLGTGAPLSRSSREGVSGLPKPIRVLPILAVLVGTLLLAVGLWIFRARGTGVDAEATAAPAPPAAEATTAPKGPQVEAPQTPPVAGPTLPPTAPPAAAPPTAPSSIAAETPRPTVAPAGAIARSAPAAPKPSVVAKPAAAKPGAAAKPVEPARTPPKPARDLLDVRN